MDDSRRRVEHSCASSPLRHPEGLNPNDYVLGSPPNDADLSRVAGRFASDLSRGRVSPTDLGYDLDVPRPPFDATAVVRALATAVDLPQALDSLEPQLVHYKLLRAALARYRAIASTRAGAPVLPTPPHNRVRPGESYVGAPALRDLLRAVGDLPASPTDTHNVLVIDTALEQALRSFQSRHGLEPDGVLGLATYRALTVPIESRVRQIELSMERIRWLPQRLDSPPIIVNIPQFRLFAFRTTTDRAQDILQMDVIVGSDFRGRRTPVFAADMKYVVLEPYWDVPRSILVKELLPQIEGDRSWIERNGYEIVRGQSDASPAVAVNAENVALLAQGNCACVRSRVRPTRWGGSSSCFPTVIRFICTTRRRRPCSHGAGAPSVTAAFAWPIPLTLLEHVMRDDPAWSLEKRDAALASGTPVRIPVPHPDSGVHPVRHGARDRGGARDVLRRYLRTRRAAPRTVVAGLTAD